MARGLKIALYILLGLVTLLLASYIIVAAYINTHKKETLAKVLHTLNSNIKGSAEIGDMETSLFRSFPGVGLVLRNVQLKDSLFAQHGHQLLNAKDIDVSINLFSLILGKTNIQKISVNNALVYLYTDSNGYSNTQMFDKEKPKPDSLKQQGPSSFPEIRKINFDEVRLVVDDRQKFKKFDFSIDYIQGKVDYPLDGFSGALKLKTQANSFAFNTQKGSFIKNQALSGTIKFNYSKLQKMIYVLPSKLKIGADDFIVGAKINFQDQPTSFVVDIEVNNVLYADVASKLAPNISSKLLRFKVKNPVDIKGKITDNGKNPEGVDPIIQVWMKVRNNDITIPSGLLINASFDGSFSNKDTLSHENGDGNSIIKFKNLKANYYNAPITCDSFMVRNLDRPIATGRILSDFPLSNLNSSIGGETFDFKGGRATLDLYCQTDIDHLSFVKPRLRGSIKIKEADILYVPKNIRMVKSSMNIDFNDRDLKISDGRFELGKSVLKMDLFMANFLNYYYTDPEKIVAKLNLYSPNLELGQLIPLLHDRSPKKKQSKPGNTVKEISQQLERVIANSQLELNLKVDQTIYKKFVAKNLNAQLLAGPQGISIKQANVQHAGGKINLSGNIHKQKDNNKFNVKTRIQQVSVKQFFYAFDNFGMKTLTSNNLNGLLSSDATISGTLTNAGDLFPRSLKGSLTFNLNKAALLNFKPMEGIQKYAFANRNLANIRFEKLSGQFNIDGEKIQIAPMQINSTAINFDIKGIYSLGNGTDISLDIPLRNPERDLNKTELEKSQNRMRGIVLHLQAVDDNKGGVRIKWNSRDHGIF